MTLPNRNFFYSQAMFGTLVNFLREVEQNQETALLNEAISDAEHERLQINLRTDQLSKLPLQVMTKSFQYRPLTVLLVLDADKVKQIYDTIEKSIHLVKALNDLPYLFQSRFKLEGQAAIWSAGASLRAEKYRKHLLSIVPVKYRTEVLGIEAPTTQAKFRDRLRKPADLIYIHLLDGKPAFCNSREIQLVDVDSPHRWHVPLTLRQLRAEQSKVVKHIRESVGDDASQQFQARLSFVSYKHPNSPN